MAQSCDVSLGKRLGLTFAISLLTLYGCLGAVIEGRQSDAGNLGRGRVGVKQEPEPANSPATGRGSYQAWWRDVEIKKALRLTEAQANQVEAIYKGLQTETVPLMGLLEKRRKETEWLIEQRGLMPEELLPRLRTQESLKGELNAIRAVALYRMDLVLKPEQHEVLQQLLKARSAAPNGPTRGPQRQPAK